MLVFCLCVAVVVLFVIAVGVAVGVEYFRLSDLVVGMLSCAETCSMFVWDRFMCYLGVILMISTRL